MLRFCYVLKEDENIFKGRPHIGVQHSPFIVTNAWKTLCLSKF